MISPSPRLESSIRKCLVPHLRQDGFSGAGRTFRRLKNGWLQVVSVQGSRYGGQFAVNLGNHPSSIPDVLGNEPDPKKITEPLCEFRRRLTESSSDQWWKHDGSSSSMEAAMNSAAEVYVRIGRPLLEEMAASNSPLSTVSPEQFATGKFDFHGFGSTEVRMALVLARLRKAEGRLSESRGFAMFGLAKLKFAGALKRELQELCSQE